MMFPDDRERDSPEEIALYRGIAERMRAARISAGLSHADVAERTGMKKGYLFELERGATNPTVRTLYRISSALGIGPDQLMPRSVRLEVDQLTVDALLILCAGLMKSLEQGKAAYEKAFQKDAAAVRAVMHAVEEMNKGAPRSAGSDQRDAIEGDDKTD